jgi:hypothetical protein
VRGVSTKQRATWAMVAHLRKEVSDLHDSRRELKAKLDAAERAVGAAALDALKRASALQREYDAEFAILDKAIYNLSVALRGDRT